MFCIDTDLYQATDLFDSGVMKTAMELSRFGGGGTALGLCGEVFNDRGNRWGRPDLVVVVSDNESWADRSYWGNQSTKLMDEWTKYKHHNRNARLVLLDLVPSSNSQVKTRPDVLNVAGFSDKVFDVIAAFASADDSADFWMRQVEAQTACLAARA